MLIIEAKYASESGEDIVIKTDTDPSIAINRNDAPELWAVVKASGVEIAPYIRTDE